MGQGRRRASPVGRGGLVTLAVVIAVLLLAPAALANGAVAPVWVQTWNAKTPGVVTDVHVARAPTGEFYVACSILRSTTGKYDLIVARYRANGTREWVHSWSRGDAYDDRVAGLAADPDGRVVVVGWSTNGKSGTPDWCVVKYGRLGKLLWSRNIGGAAGGDDRAVDVVVNRYARIYVAGYFTQKAGDKDWRMIKLTPGGDTSWAIAYRGADGLDDVPSAMALDVDGNVYLTGTEGTDRKVRADAVTIQVARDGTRNWVAKYDDAGEETGVDVAVRKSGVVVAVEKIDQAGVVKHAVNVGYTRDGTQVWAEPFVADETESDVCLTAGIDGLGRGAFGGSYVDKTTDSFALLSRRAPDGVLETTWSATGPAVAAGDQFNDLSVAFDGTVWATGSIGGAATTVSLDPAGAQRWYGEYETDAADSGDALALAPKSVYVAGLSGDDLVFIRYVR